MSLPRFRPFLAAGFALTLALGLSACGDDEPDDSSSPPSDSSSESSDPSEPEESDPAGEETEPEEEAPAGGVVFVDAVDSPAATVTVSDSGFDPAETTVAVGDVVVFTTGGGDGIFGVIVGGLDGYTVTNGIDEYFRFDAPGSYEVHEDISGNKATVTVE